jgi:hypothetical protein
MSGINHIPIYRNGHTPERVIPRDEYDATCPHCTQLGYGAIINYELQFRGISPSSENGINTHVLIYGMDAGGVLKYIPVPISTLKKILF